LTQFQIFDPFFIRFQIFDLNLILECLVIYGSERGFHAIDIESGSPYDLFLPTHQQPPIIPHAIVVLPESEGMELLLCYNDEGVYVNTYSEVTKDVMMQWGELPASVAYIRSGQVNTREFGLIRNPSNRKL